MRDEQDELREIEQDALRFQRAQDELGSVVGQW